MLFNMTKLGSICSKQCYLPSILRKPLYEQSAVIGNITDLMNNITHLYQMHTLILLLSIKRR